MSPRIPDTHAEAWDLLPWLANGRLSAGEREWVEAHAHQCPQCRAELSAQRALVERLRIAEPHDAVREQRSFDKLWSRIEAASAADTAVAEPPLPMPRPSRSVRWLVAAVIVQGIGLSLFGASAWRSRDLPHGDFVTVTQEPRNARADAPRVSLVFEPSASIATVNALLSHQGLSVISGPGLAGNFTAELSPEAVAAGASARSVAAVLALDPHVTFAQPVTP